MLLRRLRALGISAVVVSSSVSEAAPLVEKEPRRFDLVIIDSSLDGWRDFVFRVKNLSLLCDVVVLGASAEAIETRDAGASFVIPRPLDENEAAGIFARVFEGQKYRDEDLGRFHVEDLRKDWLELTASSEFECLERFKHFSDVIFQSDLDEKSRRDLIIALSELGQNAIEWGNQFDPSKKVNLSYAVFDDRIMLKIQDEGRGFNFRNIEDPTINPMEYYKKREATGKRVGGYGVFLVRKLMDKVVYNEKGNIVIMIKKLRTDKNKPDPRENR